MFDLFRFVMLRPPEPVALDDAIVIRDRSDFQLQLQGAHEFRRPASAFRPIANSFIASPAFVSDTDTLQFASGLASFEDRILSDQPPGSLDELNEALIGIFDQTAAGLQADGRWQAERQRLRDSLVAAKLGDVPLGAPLELLAQNIRRMDLVARVAGNDAALNGLSAIRAGLRRPIVISPELLPEAVTPVGAPENGGNNAPPQPDAELTKRYQALVEAQRYLSHVDTNSLETASAAARPGGDENAPPAAIDNAVLFREIRALRDLADEEAGPGIARTARLLKSDFLVGSTMTVKASALDRLAPEARAALETLRIDPTAMQLPMMLDRVNRELDHLGRQIKTPLQPSRANVSMIGSKFYLSDLIQDQFPLFAPGPLAPLLLPTTHGTVKPVGIGDLLVVKQQLKGYELGEVAYIENILLGEAHSRSTRRTETVEESVTTDRETVQEEERDLQSTERFELRRESEQAATMEGQLQSPSYGGLVEFQSSPNTPINGSQTVAKREAETHGKEVTSRATSRITERTRTQTFRRTVREFEEKVEHAYDNKEGEANVVGIYQWVDKLYEAQVFNYGKRLMYDIVIPEPAAFLIQALARQGNEGRELVKPEPFTLAPTEITEYNYGMYVARYNVSGVEPPPPVWQTVSRAHAESSGDKVFIHRNVDIPLPKGYEARNYKVCWTTLRYAGQPPEGFSIILGSTNVTTGEPGLHGETTNLAMLMTGYNLTHLGVAADVFCERSAALYQQWQARTYDLIAQAFERQMAEYEERVANLEAAMRVGALGQSAEEKRALERVELKKGAISVFTYQYFDFFNGIDVVAQIHPVTGASMAYPQIRLPDAEAQGKYIRFFEQAFEWEQMMYSLYPYFWGRKNHWLDNALREDPDQQFADFLRAGGARVVIPVRPGFETAIVHFVETGEIWEGGEPPALNTPTYVPIITELQAANQMPGAEVPYGDPWQLRLPTSLVRLRPNDVLPKWVKQNGEWVPDGE